MTNKPDLSRLFEFQKLLLAFSQIERVVDRKHHGKYIKETDTEHSYNLAMTAWYLAPNFPHLDRDALIRIALVHDMVEIHAGDTFVYADEATLATKAARESAALQQLREEWPDFSEMTDVITTYEEKSTEEAKFVYALDKVMPMMVIYLADGHTWKREGVTIKVQHAAKKDKVALSEDIKPYYDALHQLLLNSPHLIPKA